jgi:hypothetical protein
MDLIVIINVYFLLASLYRLKHVKERRTHQFFQELIVLKSLNFVRSKVFLTYGKMRIINTVTMNILILYKYFYFIGADDFNLLGKIYLH